jgi:hypothetical protein
VSSNSNGGGVLALWGRQASGEFKNSSGCGECGIPLAAGAQYLFDDRVLVGMGDDGDDLHGLPTCRAQGGIVEVHLLDETGPRRRPLGGVYSAVSPVPMAALTLGSTSSASSDSERFMRALSVQSWAVTSSVPKGPISSRSARIFSATVSGLP